jgi:predicted DNA-binding protein
MAMRKTSVYMDDKLAERLARLASEEGISQAQVLREAIAAYQPKRRPDRDFALAGGFERIDDDPRPISEIPDEELLKGFGE